MQVGTLIYIEFLKYFIRNNILILFLLSLVAIVVTELNMAATEIELSSAPTIDSLRETYARACIAVGVYYMAFSIIATTGKEFSTGTFKKNIIDGYQRSDFILAKLLSILIHIVSLFISMLLGYIILFIMKGYTHSIMNFSGNSIAIYLFKSSVVFFAYGSIGLLTVILLRNPVGASVAFFLYLFSEKMLYTLNEKQWHTGFFDYLPMNLIDGTILINDTINVSDQSLPKVVLLILYLILTICLSVFLLSKRDI